MTACVYVSGERIVCGRPVWRSDKCILHDDGLPRPLEDFAKAVGSEIDTAAREGVAARLDGVRWFGLPLSAFDWPGPVSFSGATFLDRSCLGDAVFHAPVDFSGATFIWDIRGRPRFLGAVSFRNVSCDGINLKDAMFEAEADFSHLEFFTDSFVTRCRFAGLASFERCKIWELHFQQNEFVSGLSLASSRGRISITGYNRFCKLLDISGVTVQMSDIDLKSFDGVLRAERTLCEGAFRVSKASLQVGSSLKGIQVAKDLRLSDVRVEGDFSLEGAIVDGTLALIDIEVNGLLNLSKMALHQRDLRLVRVAGPEGAHVRLGLGGTDFGSAQFHDVAWPRSDIRLRLADEDLLRGKTDSSAQELMYTYRRLRAFFEQANMFEEAEDCVWAAMDMRRRSPRTSPLARAVLRLYGVVSHFGSRFERAVGVLLFLLLVFFPVVFAAVGLDRPLEMADSSPASSASPLVVQSLGGTAERLWGTASVGYARGVVHTLEVAALKDETRFSTSSAIGSGVEAVARAALAGQLAILLLAMRRRFGR